MVCGVGVELRHQLAADRLAVANRPPCARLSLFPRRVLGFWRLPALKQRQVDRHADRGRPIAVHGIAPAAPGDADLPVQGACPARAKTTSASPARLPRSASLRAQGRKRIDPGPQPDRIDIEHRRVARRLQVRVAAYSARAEPAPAPLPQPSRRGDPAAMAARSWSELERTAFGRALPTPRRAITVFCRSSRLALIRQVELPEVTFSIIEDRPRRGRSRAARCDLRPASPASAIPISAAAPGRRVALGEIGEGLGLNPIGVAHQ